MQKCKKLLLEELKKEGIQNPRVLDAFLKVERINFVPEILQKFAYENTPLAIGYEQTISQPYMALLLCELLEIESGMKVLEIGTGSGYQAALLKELGAEVYTIERIEALYLQAKQRLEPLSIHCFLGDGLEGLPSYAPFDRILFTAACEEISEQIENQINRENGIIVAPIGKEWEVQQIFQIIWHKKERKINPLSYCRFVPVKKGVLYQNLK